MPQCETIRKINIHGARVQISELRSCHTCQTPAAGRCAGSRKVCTITPSSGRVCTSGKVCTIFACFESMHAMQGLAGCGLSGTPNAFLLGAGSLFTAVSLLPFGYLLLLHTYLLATNRTTCEVVKGAKCAYLAPYFEGTCSTMYHLPEDLHVLLWNEMQGRGPPKPFSQGVWNNVMAQIATAWPRQYVARPP